MSVDINLETPIEKAVICSWMYIRKVSECQRPIFLTWMSEHLLRCMAIAPPALEGMPCPMLEICSKNDNYEIYYVRGQGSIQLGCPLAI